MDIGALSHGQHGQQGKKGDKGAGKGTDKGKLGKGGKDMKPLKLKNDFELAKADCYWCGRKGHLARDYRYKQKCTAMHFSKHDAVSRSARP